MKMRPVDVLNNLKGHVLWPQSYHLSEAEAEVCIRALEQEPKTGHWIKTPKAVMGEGYMWYCDKCEHQVYQDSSRDYPSEKYCPNCGAKMVEKQEGSDKE